VITPGDHVPVSVVISTLDRPGMLARCLDALLAGTRLPTEIVVVDQGDAAATAAVLDARRDRGIRLVHVPQNRRGLSVSQNTGVQQARCAVVSVVDDDCVPDSRWVEIVATEHARAPGPLLVTGRVLPLPADGDRILAVSSRTSTQQAVLGPGVLPWRIGTGGNFSVARTAYLEAGGNDERLGTGAPGKAGNDLDLFHRLLRAGVEAHYEPDLLVHHARVTEREHRGRRWTYGFGVGVCVVSWLRDGDRSAVPVLVAWISMRLRRLARARRPGAAIDELRVLLGTVRGLWCGLLMGSRRLTMSGPR
jgi:glycosyltransferase involved in cell wall biosynthesis